MLLLAKLIQHDALLLDDPGLHDAILLMEKFGLFNKLFKLCFRHGLDPWGADARKV
ncbi:hypothetical protein D3C76_1514180 [compost metagenome]